MVYCDKEFRRPGWFSVVENSGDLGWFTVIET